MTCNDCKYYSAFTDLAGFCDLIDLDWQKLNYGGTGALAGAILDCQRDAKMDSCEHFEQYIGEPRIPGLTDYLNNGRHIRPYVLNS